MSDQPVIIVGVVPDQPGPVLDTAIEYARRWGARLVFARVETNRYLVGENPDGTITSALMMVEVADFREEVFDPELRAEIATVLDPSGVEWDTRPLVGDAVRAITHLANELHAIMIVVGTRQPTFRGAVGEFFRGSVAAGLAHRQHRPVVVVPTAPTPEGEPLPWDV